MRNNPARILIVDDMKDMRYLLHQLVEQEGMEAMEAQDGETALHMVRRQSLDVMLLDIRMPGLDGYQVLQQVQKLDSDLQVIMITAYGAIEDAVRMVKDGAYDYLTKPFENEDVVLSIRRALDESHRKRRYRRQVTGAENQLPLQEIMGRSEKTIRLAAEVARVAATKFSIVITGETGVGKEVVARAIHQQSGQPVEKWVAVDCGAIPETLIESELFGYEKGAFTGATRSQDGKFAVARGGTLFLDEISNLPLSMQVKLLRVLQEKCFYCVGGTRPLTTDVRIIATTNQNLDPGVGPTTFRQDLYHRLSEYVIHVPPLRERQEDIIFLVKRFIDLTNEELQKNVQGVSEAALERLLTYDWPGNVRELRNYIRRGVLLAEEMIEPEHLGALPAKASDYDVNPERHTDGFINPEERSRFPLKEILARHIITVEREAILQTLEQTGGNKAEAARRLQIDYKTIHTKIKKYEISSNGGDHVRQG